MLKLAEFNETHAMNLLMNARTAISRCTSQLLSTTFSVLRLRSVNPVIFKHRTPDKIVKMVELWRI